MEDRFARAVTLARRDPFGLAGFFRGLLARMIHEGLVGTTGSHSERMDLHAEMDAARIDGLSEGVEGHPDKAVLRRRVGGPVKEGQRRPGDPRPFRGLAFVNYSG